MSWLIWSLEHRGWRKPAGWGYTTATNKAGFCAEGEAKEIVDRSNSAVRPGGWYQSTIAIRAARRLRLFSATATFARSWGRQLGCRSRGQRAPLGKHAVPAHLKA